MNAKQGIYSCLIKNSGFRIKKSSTNLTTDNLRFLQKLKFQIILKISQKNLGANLFFPNFAPTKQKNAFTKQF